MHETPIHTVGWLVDDPKLIHRPDGMPVTTCTLEVFERRLTPEGCVPRAGSGFSAAPGPASPCTPTTASRPVTASWSSGVCGSGPSAGEALASAWCSRTCGRSTPATKASPLAADPRPSVRRKPRHLGLWRRHER